MEFNLTNLTVGLKGIDTDDVLSCWLWCLGDIKQILLISVIGDLFLQDADGNIFWLNTGESLLTKVAETFSQFELLLEDDGNIDNWFLPLLVEQLINAGKTLKKDQVYSFLKPPIIGGEYSVDNFSPTNISVHFAFSGQICEQVKDLPDGTKVNIKVSD